MADRTETAYHIHKDATARYAPYLRHAQLPTYKLSLVTRLYGQWLIEHDLNNLGIVACAIAAAKGNQILGLIRRNIVYKEKELIIPLYKTIVRPHLEYCIQAWRLYRKKDSDILERVQRRATKMIQKLRNISYEMRLKECGLTTLETRRLRGDQIEVFKILNGYENIDRNIFFSVKEDRRTRGHGITLAKKQCRLDIRKFSFSQRTVNE